MTSLVPEPTRQNVKHTENDKDNELTHIDPSGKLVYNPTETAVNRWMSRPSYRNYWNHLASEPVPLAPGAQAPCKTTSLGWRQRARSAVARAMRSAVLRMRECAIALHEQNVRGIYLVETDAMVVCQHLPEVK